MRNSLSTVAGCACVLSFAIGAATCHGAPGSQTGGDRQRDAVSAMRIYSHAHTGDEKAAYTLRIDSPWPDGGQLHVNFPEHLEYGPVGYTITTSKDDARAVILYAPIGKSVLSNRHISCLHADPYFGHVKSGQQVKRIVNVIFAGADWHRVVDETAKQHARQGSQQADMTGERRD